MILGKLQFSCEGKASLLLHLAAALVMLQFVFWCAEPQPTETPASPLFDQNTGGRYSGHATLNLGVQLQSAPARFFGGDQTRYYNPGLAMAAQSLDAESRYFSAMALEECYALSHNGLARFRDEFLRRLNSANTAADHRINWMREHAFSRSNRDCLVFDGTQISPNYVLGLIKSAAYDGDPRAIARTLLFRDLADSKAGSFELVAGLLATGDPYTIRDVGLYLTRGESTLTLGGLASPVLATTLAVAWELVACDFGLDCGADSKLLNNLCAYQSQCGAFSYEDWLRRYTGSGEEFSEILRLRAVLLRGLIMQDWQLLGLAALTSDVPVKG